jgi:hypothetical protein
MRPKFFDTDAVIAKALPLILAAGIRRHLGAYGSGAYQNKCNSEGDIDVLKVDGF